MAIDTRLGRQVTGGPLRDDGLRLGGEATIAGIDEIGRDEEHEVFVVLAPVLVFEEPFQAGDLFPARARSPGPHARGPHRGRQRRTGPKGSTTNKLIPKFVLTTLTTLTIEEEYAKVLNWLSDIERRLRHRPYRPAGHGWHHRPLP
jgi:hypothetical protein